MINLIGQTLGQYQIVEKIGEGGMAAVYRAYQPGLDRYIALKILPPVHAQQPGFTDRFVREAKAIANLNHPNILPVYDFGQQGEYSFIAMRYIEGARTLREVMQQPLSLDRMADLIQQLAAALDHAHRQGVIHRDVKPSNVLMDNHWALLTDFGLAKMTEASIKLTGTGVGIGTPAYMSPEQGQGQTVDHRTDIYALGVILFEMLTGQIPHNAETPFAIILKRVTDPLPLPRSINPQISEAVEKVVLKALALNPDDRYQSAGALAAAFEQAIQAVPAADQPTVASPTLPRAERRPRKTGLMIGAAVGLLLLLVVMVGLGFWLGQNNIGNTTASVASVSASPAATDSEAIIPTPPSPVVSSTATPAPAANNRFVYKVQENGAESLYATDLNGSDPHRLASGADSIWARLAPDGERVIVRLQRGDQYTLYLMNFDGSNRQVLVSAPNYPWAFFDDTGQRIIARWEENDQTNLVTMQADGSQPVTLFSGYSLLHRTFNQDQQVLVRIKQNEEDPYQLFLSNIDGSNLQPLPFPLNDDENLSWTFGISEDGEWLYYNTLNQGEYGYNLYLTNLDGSQSTQLVTDANYCCSVTLSPAAKKILFMARQDSEEPYTLTMMDIAGGQQQLLADGDLVRGRFSADGSRLILRVEQNDNWAVSVLSADGAQKVDLITHAEQFNWYADGYFAPDGEHVLVHAGQEDPYRSGMYLFKADGSERVELARAADWQLQAAFTADSQQIIFDSNRDGDRAIFAANADGSEIRRVTAGYGPGLVNGEPSGMVSHPTRKPSPTPTQTPPIADTE